MFHRSQLDGYAEQITDTAQQQEFRRVVGSFNFDNRGLCSGGEVDVMNGTALEPLKADFVARHLEFLTESVWKQVAGLASQ